MTPLKTSPEPAVASPGLAKGLMKIAPSGDPITLKAPLSSITEFHSRLRDRTVSIRESWISLTLNPQSLESSLGCGVMTVGASRSIKLFKSRLFSPSASIRSGEVISLQRFLTNPVVRE